MHVFKNENRYILYNENNLEFYSINKELGEKLIGIGDEKIAEMLNLKEENCEVEGYISEKCERFVLVISQDCNLACKYCYAQQGSYGENHSKLMDFETFKQSIKFLLSKFPKGINKLQFFGGEPLLNVDLIEKGCEWVTEYFNELNIEIPMFSIVTNGTIINDKIINLFNKYSMNVTISLDGNKEVNDINRVFKTINKSVFEEVKKNIELLNEKRKFSLCIEMTIDKANIEQFIENGENVLDIEEIHALKPEVIHLVPASWSNNCAYYDNDYIHNLKRYFDNVTKYSIETLTTCNPMGIIKIMDMADRLIKKKRKMHFCSAGINELSVNCKGDIYPCFTFIGKKEFCMGNVYDFNKNNKTFNEIQSILIKNTFDNNEKCKTCWVKGICSNCIGNSFLINGSINKPISEICEVQKVQLERIMAEFDKLASRRVNNG